MADPRSIPPKPAEPPSASRPTPDVGLSVEERVKRFMASRPKKPKARPQDGESCETCKELGSQDPGPVAFSETLLGETRHYCEGHWPGW